MFQKNTETNKHKIKVVSKVSFGLGYVTKTYQLNYNFEHLAVDNNYISLLII